MLNALDCDDGDLCIVVDGCKVGVCEGFFIVCECIIDVDCAQFEDDDLCNGTFCCEMVNMFYKCVVDLLIVVICLEL